MINNSILYFLPAKHFNEEEFFITKNLLEKNGFKSFVTSDKGDFCEGSNGRKFRPDMKLENVHPNNFAGIVLTGGYGAKDYWTNSRLQRILNEFNDSKKMVAAICFAPVILANAGLLNGKAATCHFEAKQDFSRPEIEFKDVPVVVTKNIITANGPKASFEFAESVIFVLNKLKT